MITVLNPELIGQQPALPESNIGQWHTVERQDGQIIGGRLFVPQTVRSDREILLDGIAYSVHASTPRDVDRTSRIAEASELVTIALEVPGMSPYSGPLTEEQKVAMKNGDWSELGRAQWDVITHILAEIGIEYSEEDPLTVHLAGFSMSASSNIGLIESAPAGIQTGTVVAWENTAWVDQPTKFAKARRMAQLILGMIHGGIGLKKYQTASPARDTNMIDRALKSEVENGFRKKVPQSLGKKFGSFVLPVIGMSAGGDAVRLRNTIVAREETDTASVRIFNGAKSRLSSTLDNVIAHGILREAGINSVVETDEDGRHGVEDSLYVSVPRYVSSFHA